MRLIAAACLMLAGAANAATVVVDTGHSLFEGGSRAADGTSEFRINRAMAQAVIAELQKGGVTVVDVHAEKDDTTLGKRVSRTQGADLFLSLHHDSIQQRYLDAGREREFAGYAVFVSGLNKHVRPSLKCSITIADAMQRAGVRPSLYHAEPVKGENRPLLEAARGIHRYDNLVVLKSSQSPAVLLEVGVIVNPDELALLRDARWVQSTAVHIAAGVRACIPGKAAKR